MHHGLSQEFCRLCTSGRTGVSSAPDRACETETHGGGRVACAGVEAAGFGVDTDKHAATLTKGTPGVLHGSMSYLIQDADGQIVDPHSISAGLDYPGVGPEHAFLKEMARAEYIAVTDDAVRPPPSLRVELTECV